MLSRKLRVVGSEGISAQMLALGESIDARIHHFVALTLVDRVAKVERRPAPEPFARLRIEERLG